jgi:ArsR family transcriptional regulator
MSKSLPLLTPTEQVACCSPLLKQPLGADEAARIAPLLKALADPVRLRLLSLVASYADQEACVCDLNDAFDLSQPTISHHLKVLREAGWVDSERRGTWIWYWMQPDAIDRFQALAGGFGGPARRSGTRQPRRLPVVQPSRAAVARA